MQKLGFDLLITQTDLAVIQRTGSTLEQAIYKATTNGRDSNVLTLDQMEFMKAYRSAEVVEGLIIFQVNGLTFRIKIESRDEIPAAETRV